MVELNTVCRISRLRKYLLFFLWKRQGKLTCGSPDGDYRRPRPRAAPGAAGALPAFEVGWAPQPGNTWCGAVAVESAHACWLRVAGDVTTTRTLVASYDTASTRMILFYAGITRHKNVLYKYKYIYFHTTLDNYIFK